MIQEDDQREKDKLREDKEQAPNSPGMQHTEHSFMLVLGSRFVAPEAFLTYGRSSLERRIQNNEYRIMYRALDEIQKPQSLM